MLQGCRGSPAGYLILLSYFTAGHSLEGTSSERDSKCIFLVGADRALVGEEFRTESTLSHLGVRGLKAIPALMPLQALQWGRNHFPCCPVKKMKIRAGPVEALSFTSDIISP